MQRALFWLVPSIRSSQQNVVAAIREHVYATEEVLKVLQQTNLQLELLRRSVEEWQSNSKPQNSVLAGQGTGAGTARTEAAT
jgi:hypothetical protein